MHQYRTVGHWALPQQDNQTTKLDKPFVSLFQTQKYKAKIILETSRWNESNLQWSKKTSVGTVGLTLTGESSKRHLSELPPSENSELACRLCKFISVDPVFSQTPPGASALLWRSEVLMSDRRVGIWTGRLHSGTESKVASDVLGGWEQQSMRLWGLSCT